MIEEQRCNLILSRLCPVPACQRLFKKSPRKTQRSQRI